MTPMLKFENVCAGYGKINVLNSLSFEVAQGEVLGVIGPNGSGKTTMLNVLTGLIRISSGAMLLDGTDISRLSVDARCKLGIGRTFQIPRPFSRMTVYENVLTAAVFGSGFSESEGREPALDVLRLTNLYDRRDILAGDMTLLDLKRLEIARAIVARPRLLLLDEVAAGLTGEEINDLMKMIATLKTAGFTIVWIEHIMETMLRATDKLMCMAEGKCAVIGPPDKVISSKEVEYLYLGGGTEETDYAEG